jgi:hypothetical protein
MGNRGVRITESDFLDFSVDGDGKTLLLPRRCRLDVRELTGSDVHEAIRAALEQSLYPHRSLRN